MKSRAEIMAERKAASTAKSVPEEKPTKPSAASRTLPIPGTEQVHCPDCETDMRTSDLKKREDGSYECNTCAMPLKVGDSDRATKLAEGAASRLHDKKSKVETRTGSFCGKCGAEWPIMDGKEVRNCGHEDALCVDDPRKATNMSKVTASGVTKPPAGPVESHEIPANVKVSVDGNRITMTWGKCIFPVGEAIGISKFSNMEIGPFNISDTFEPTLFAETMRRMLANLQKIADMTFDTQFVWYKKKLGLLDK